MCVSVGGKNTPTLCEIYTIMLFTINANSEGKFHCLKQVIFIQTTVMKCRTYTKYMKCIS